ncbi:MAG: 4-hydroxybenzoate octaprenyltransferase [Hyphomicrobiaceae bacterium]
MSPSEPVASSPVEGRVADAAAGNWVDHYAPRWMRPYARLARFDRPIGAWLLLMPCWWSTLLAQKHVGQTAPNLWFMALFLIGAFVMRGAGCTWNDIVDRDYDARVRRTASRPIPSGQVTARQALVFAVGLCLCGLAVLLQFNWFTVAVGAASLALVAVYPFSKRYTYWPQVVLGLTFKWGALVGWAAVTGGLAPAAFALYAGSVLWTIGYDTIYAHQDKEDDLLLGLKSTALRFGAETYRWLVGFYGGAVLLWLFAGAFAGSGVAFYVGLAAVSCHLGWQVATLDIEDASGCLVRFKSNRDVGLLLTAAMALDLVVAG